MSRSKFGGSAASIVRSVALPCNNMQDVQCSFVNSNMFVTQKLIEVVQKYPLLYDLSNGDYKNTRRKDKLWNKLGAEMNSTGPNLKKRWKNLRDTYAKHLKCIQAQVQSGKKNYRYWQWAKQMEYFRPYMPVSHPEAPNPDTGNFQTVNIKSEVDESVENYDVFSEFSAENVNNVSEDVDEMLSESYSFSSPSLEQFDEPSPITDTANQSTSTKSVPDTKGVTQYLYRREGLAEIDPIELILLSYAKTIKTFSPERQAQIKLKFAEVMMEQECEHYREQQQEQKQP